MIAAFLCGMFYGALALDAWKREAANRRLDGMLAELREYWNKGEGCGCDECCGCGEIETTDCHFEPKIVYGQCSSTGCEDA